jgi:hypothetical protein
MGQLDYGNALGPEEEDEGNDPEPDSDAAVGRYRWNYVQIEDSNYEEQDEVAASEGADEVGLGGLGGGGQCLSRWLKLRFFGYLF